MLKILADHYGKGLALGTLLVAGTKTKGMESIAEDLLWLQLTRWKKGGKMVRVFCTLLRLDKEGGKTVDELFTFLKLDKEGDKLSKSTWFLLWLRFVKLRYEADDEAYNLAKEAAKKLADEAAKMDEAYKAVLSTLDHHYESDLVLYHILRTGLMVDNKEVSDIASKLLKMRFSHEPTTGNS